MANKERREGGLDVIEGGGQPLQFYDATTLVGMLGDTLNRALDVGTRSEWAPVATTRLAGNTCPQRGTGED